MSTLFHKISKNHRKNRKFALGAKAKPDSKSFSVTLFAKSKKLGNRNAEILCDIVKLNIGDKALTRFHTLNGVLVDMKPKLV